MHALYDWSALREVKEVRTRWTKAAVDQNAQSWQGKFPCRVTYLRFVPVGAVAKNTLFEWCDGTARRGHCGLFYHPSCITLIQRSFEIRWLPVRQDERHM